RNRSPRHSALAAIHGAQEMLARALHRVEHPLLAGARVEAQEWADPAGAAGEDIERRFGNLGSRFLDDRESALDERRVVEERADLRGRESCAECAVVKRG